VTGKNGLVPPDGLDSIKASWVAVGAFPDFQSESVNQDAPDAVVVSFQISLDGGGGVNGLMNVGGGGGELGPELLLLVTLGMTGTVVVNPARKVSAVDCWLIESVKFVVSLVFEVSAYFCW
jgi:hypothetical protein